MFSINNIWVVICIVITIGNLLRTFVISGNEIKHLQQSLDRIKDQIADLYEKHNELNSAVSYIKGILNSHINGDEK